MKVGEHLLYRRLPMVIDTSGVSRWEETVWPSVSCYKLDKST